MENGVKIYAFRKWNFWKRDATTEMKLGATRNSCRRSLKFCKGRAKSIREHFKNLEFRRTVSSNSRIRANKARWACRWAPPRPTPASPRTIKGKVPSNIWASPRPRARIWFQTTTSKRMVRITWIATTASVKKSKSVTAQFKDSKSPSSTSHSLWMNYTILVTCHLRMKLFHQGHTQTRPRPVSWTCVNRKNNQI